MSAIINLSSHTNANELLECIIDPETGIDASPSVTPAIDVSLDEVPRWYMLKDLIEEPAQPIDAAGQDEGQQNVNAPPPPVAPPLRDKMFSFTHSELQISIPT